MHEQYQQIFDSIASSEISTSEGLEELYALGFLYVPGGGPESLMGLDAKDLLNRWYEENMGRSFDTKFSFWGSEGFFHYPIIMVSAAHRGSVSISSERNYVLFSDSGGFGVDGPIKLHPTSDYGELMERANWQRSISDVAFAFDYYNTKADGHDECLRISKVYTKVYEKHFGEDASKKLFLVTHGNDFKDFEEWCSGLGGYPFRGWGTGTTFGSSIDDNAWKKFLASCYIGWKYGVETPVHLLGLSATTKYLPMVKALSKHLKRLSSDSSSWRWAGSKTQYFCIGRRGNLNRLFRGRISGAHKVESPMRYTDYCECPVCLELDVIIDKVGHKGFQDSGSLAPFLIGIHNLYLMLDILEVVPHKTKHRLKEYHEPNWNEALFTELAGDLIKDFYGNVERACRAVGYGKEML